MADSNVNLNIVTSLQDNASAALSSMGNNAQATLDGIKQSAQQVATTFGLMSAAILGPVALMVNGAAQEQAQVDLLHQSIQNAITAADGEAGSTSEMTAKKKLLEAQLITVNAKLAEYEQKADSSKGATGLYTAEVTKLSQQADTLKDKLSALNSVMSLQGANADTITSSFVKAAQANTNLGFTMTDSLTSFNAAFSAFGNVNTALMANQAAMDLSRSKGIELTTATKLVDQAMQGSGRALSQYNISMKDGLTPMQAFDELQGKIGGDAKAFAASTAGQMQVATAKTNELSDTLGNSLLPAVSQALSTLTPFIDKLTDWIQKNPQLTTTIMLAVVAIGLLFGIIAVVAGAIAACIVAWPAFVALGGFIAAAFTIATGPIGLFVLAIIAAGIIFYAFYQLIKENWTNITKEFNQSLSAITNLWNTTWKDIGDFFTGIWKGIESAFDTSINYVKTELNSFLNWVNGIIGQILSPIQNLGSAVGNAISSVQKTVGSVISAAVPKFATGGIVNGPTLAMVGEAGPEAIIPLSAFNQGGSLARGGGGSGNGGIVVNINGGMFTSQEGARQVANTIAKLINQNIKLRTF